MPDILGPYGEEKTNTNGQRILTEPLCGEHPTHYEHLLQAQGYTEENVYQETRNPL